MASLREFFVKDGSQNLTVHEMWTITEQDGSAIGEVVARLHYDFDANAKYISFFIPELENVVCPEAIVLNQLGQVLSWPTKTQVWAGFGQERFDGRELVFTGRIFLYSERPLSEELKQRLLGEAKPKGHNLVFRSVEYMNE